MLYWVPQILYRILLMGLGSALLTPTLWSKLSFIISWFSRPGKCFSVADEQSGRADKSPLVALAAGTSSGAGEDPPFLFPKRLLNSGSWWSS